MQALIYNGQLIHVRGADMLCLTDMWRAADCPDTGKPADWARKDGKQFIDFTAESLNVPVGHIIKAQRGKGGRTFAHWQIGFAYARYLSHEFHAWCNDIVRQHIEALAKKEEIRSNRITSRKLYAKAFFAKRGDQIGIANGTNALYGVFFGGKTAKQLREDRGLKKHESLRDNMRLSTQMAVGLAEVLSAEVITEMPKTGNEACISATTSCAEKVRGAVIAVRKERALLDIS